jgi:hypothetical protein
MEKPSLVPERAKEEELERIKSLPRKQKRAKLRIRHGNLTRNHSRVRSGLPTGSTLHFARWMAELEFKSALQRIKLDAIAATHAEPQTVAAYALAYKAGYRSVWDLKQATKSQMLDITGMGPVRLRTLSADLKSRNVQVNW